MDQGGSAALRRWPGVSAGLSLGRPARRTPGHASPGPADEGGSAGNHRVQRRAVFPGLPVVQVAATASMAALPHCRTRRARPPGPGDHSEGSGRYRAPGVAAPDPASMGSAAPRFDHPAACAARAIASMKPARGHPAPRLQAGHLAHDDALGTTGEMCKGTPPFPPPRQLWIASGWRQARPCPQGNRSRSKCLVNVHAKTGLTLSSGSRVWRRSGNGGGLAGPTGQATNRPVMPEQPDLF
jgi:hypothetical protein